MENKTELQKYIFTAKYSRTINGKKETWEESVGRVMDMHSKHLEKITHINDLEIFFDKAKEAYLNQEILGAQRALQWGGDQLIKHNFRLYNCSASYANRVNFFPELMYILLCGSGIGYSVQDHHVAMIPEVVGPSKHTMKVTIEDSIEGWSEAVKALINSYFYGNVNAEFDYSKIREKGSPISGGFRAPGYKPLESAIESLRNVLNKSIGRQITPLEAHEMACILADAVISGGVRRSALIALFSANNKEMLTCKTGDWFYKKPHLGRANNSAVILPETSKEDYDAVFKYTKEFGEPGIAYLPNTEIVFNPCFEVGMYPTWHNENGTKEYGFSVCNLTEINGSKIKTEEDFYDAAESAAILGTIQASYTDFKYVSDTTKKIVERDALIGVGITGMAENPAVLFDAVIQKKAAEIVLKTNSYVADIIGINEAARATVIKPSGTSSLTLNTASGIHPFHHYRYIRNVQVNKDEEIYSYMIDKNSIAVEDSVWNKKDAVISFPVEKSEFSILIKEDISTLDFMNYIKSTQNNWIAFGTRINHPSYKITPKTLTHNVSNTITVREGEWGMVQDFIWENKESFCGVSFIPASGDLDYPQAPFVKVLDEVELSELYGPAAILAGGLNVDAVHAFKDLWVAIDTALNKGENLEFKIGSVLNIVKENTTISPLLIQFNYIKDGVMLSNINAIIASEMEALKQKQNWVNRFKRFAKKYLASDLELTGQCLKQVSIYHQWMQLQQMVPMHWEEYIWGEDVKDVGSEIGAACGGGNCEINL